MHFFKFSFREIYFSDKFWKRQLFLNRKCLKTSNERTHIPLFINQFVSLIKQDVAIDNLLN